MRTGCFQRPPHFRKRMIVMALGVITQALGLSLLIRLNLGTDTCSCLTLGIANYLPLSFGTCQLLCHLITFLFVVGMDLSKIGFGTIGNMVCLGYICDFFGWVWGQVLPAGFFDSRLNVYLLLIPALLIFIVGAATYMSTGLGMSPYDGLPFILASRAKKLSFRTVRTIWDLCYLLAGLLLGATVGIVTVLLAFCSGPIIARIEQKITAYLEA